VSGCVTAKIASEKPTVDAKSVMSEAGQAFNGKYNGFPTAVHYLARPDGPAALVHVIQIQNEEVNSWYGVYVDAYSGEILSTADYGA
jgi:extracellular elastinolytic metalloproteinase